MEQEQEARAPGRPRTKDTQHRDFTLSMENIRYLQARKEQDKTFNMSAFVDAAIREKRARDAGTP